MSNFFPILSCKDLSINDKLLAIVAYAVRGVFVALACLACSRDIEDLCWSLRAWSSTLLRFWFVEPAIQVVEKFLTPRILSSNFLQASHHKHSTCVCCFSQRSQERVLCSLSCCDCHFLKVDKDTCLFACLG